MLIMTVKKIIEKLFPSSSLDIKKAQKKVACRFTVVMAFFFFCCLTKCIKLRFNCAKKFLWPCLIKSATISIKFKIEARQVDGIRFYHQVSKCDGHRKI